MANIKILPYADQDASLQRQAKLAQLLQEQAATPQEQQMVSGYVIPNSPLIGLSKMLEAYIGKKKERDVTEKQAALKQQAQAEANNWLERISNAQEPSVAYRETPIMENASDEDRTEMQPKMVQQDTDEQRGDMVPAMQKTPFVKQGMSDKEMNLELMRAMSSGNPMMQNAAQMYASLRPKQSSPTDLFSKLDVEKFTPESIRKVMATGDVSMARVKPEEMTPYQAAELDWKKKDAEVRRLETARDNARSDAQLANSQAQLELAIQARDQSKREYEINYPGASAQGGQTGGRPLDKVSYNAFKEQEAKINEAAGNFTNFRSVLGSIPPVQGIAGKRAGELATAFKAAQASIRLLQNTGVLNQGELPFLEETLADPQGFMAIANPTTRAKLEGQLSELDKLVQRKRAYLYKQYEQPLPASLQPSVGQVASGERDLSPYYEGFNQSGT